MDVASRRGNTAPPSSSAPEAPAKPPVIEPLSPARYRVQFTASPELHDKLERLTTLWPGNDLASVVEAAVSETSFDAGGTIAQRYLILATSGGPR